MIVSRHNPSTLSDIRVKDSATPEEHAAADRCSMFQTMFGLDKTTRKQLVNSVHDYVQHLRDAHANAGIHTQHQWKQLRRCLKGNAYCRKAPDVFARYALQEAVKAARRDGTGLIVSKPELVVTSLEIAPINSMVAFDTESSSDEVTDDDVTWHEVKFDSDETDETVDAASDDETESIAASTASSSPVPPLSRRQKMKVIVSALEDALMRDGDTLDTTASEVVI